jgi:hypothetical protein
VVTVKASETVDHLVSYHLGNCFIKRKSDSSFRLHTYFADVFNLAWVKTTAMAQENRG